MKRVISHVNRFDIGFGRGSIMTFFTSFQFLVIALFHVILFYRLN